MAFSRYASHDLSDALDHIPELFVLEAVAFSEPGVARVPEATRPPQPKLVPKLLEAGDSDQPG